MPEHGRVEPTPLEIQVQCSATEQRGQAVSNMKADVSKWSLVLLMLA